jgi:hypothetical protein
MCVGGKQNWGYVAEEEYNIMHRSVRSASIALLSAQTHHHRSANNNQTTNHS